MEGKFSEVFDEQQSLKCVRFRSGKVGVIDEKGKVLLTMGDYEHIEFADAGFVRVMSRLGGLPNYLKKNQLEIVMKGGETEVFHTFYVDLKSHQLYPEMPELLQFGDFEIARLGCHLCTRTRNYYEVCDDPSSVIQSNYGLYLSLPYPGVPEDKFLHRMLLRKMVYRVCLLKGDESQVYWYLNRFKDDSILIMNEKGIHSYVRLNKKTGKIMKRTLGCIENEADKAMMTLRFHEIEAEVENRIQKEAEQEKKEAALARRRKIKSLVGVEPFQARDKWGLKQNEQIVVPPIYRHIKSPVGYYCAFEMCPGRWGVLAVDGKIEVEARYDQVDIHPNGTVELTAWPRKKIKMKLQLP